MVPHENPHDEPHGTAQEAINNGRLPSAEELLGVRFYCDVYGVVRPIQPGDDPPNIHPVEFVHWFVTWLSHQPSFPGNEVEVSVLQKLWHAFAKLVEGAPPLSWPDVSKTLLGLGVKKRQADGRTSARGHGSSPTLYTIPRPKRQRRKSQS